MRTPLVAVPLLLVLGAALVLAPGPGPGAGQPARPPSAAARDDESAGRSGPGTVWRAAYSRRFPACVATVLWPPEEVPSGLVVRAPEGTVRRISLAQATHAARNGDLDARRVIGVCRR